VEDAGRPNLAPMAGGGRSAPVSVWLSASCAGAERLLSGRRRLLSGERRLLFGGRRGSGFERARERRPGGVDEMCWLLRVVRVRGLGQPFHGLTGRYGPICCETFQPTYRVFFFFLILPIRRRNVSAAYQRRIGYRNVSETPNGCTVTFRGYIGLGTPPPRCRFGGVLGDLCRSERHQPMSGP
jgi:hypothetical protein